MNQYYKCTEYIGDYYGIQPTAGGEYIVRSRDGRELSRWPDVVQARADIQRRQENDAREREERVQLWAVDREFSLAHRDLTEAQLRWQAWRCAVANERDQDPALDPVYKRAMRLDEEIRSMRQQRDPGALRQVLIQSERLILDMDSIVRGAPDDAAPVLDRSDLITLTEAAEISGISIKTLSSMVERRRIKSTIDTTEPNPQRQTRVLRSQIEALKSK